jgi:hypothetical protein
MSKEEIPVHAQTKNMGIKSMPSVPWSTVVSEEKDSLTISGSDPEID